MKDHFRNAKNVIRQALSEAADGKLIELLEAAREGMVPYFGARDGDFAGCGCFAQRITNNWCWKTDEGDLYSRAYSVLGLHDDASRQRILVSICRAEMRRRANRTIAQAEAAHQWLVSLERLRQKETR